MASQDFTLTDADCGTVIGSPSGFIVSLKMTKPPDVLNPMPRNGVHFCLRDDRPLVPGLRNVISFDPLTDWAHQGVFWLNASAGYTGNLQVISIPKGAVFEITLSDTPTVRRRAA